MTELLDRALSRVLDLPAAAQDEVAHLLLQWVGEEAEPVQLSSEEEASFAESLAQADRRQFATDAEVRSLWAKHGL